MIVFLSLFPIFLSTIIYPPSHRILRRKWNYILVLIMALALLALSLFLYRCNAKVIDKRNLLAPISLLTYLIFHKIFDEICLKKYQRNMFFFSKGGKFWGNEESRESTFFEAVLQFLLIVLSFFAWLEIGPIIISILDKYNC